MDAMDPERTNFEGYLDRWLQAQGVTLHNNTLERIADGAHEFYRGSCRSWERYIGDWKSALDKPIADR